MKLASHLQLLPLVFLEICGLAGCAKPNAANISLRKENQQLQSRIETLENDLRGAHATIQSLESHATTVPMLPATRLAELFVVQGLKLGRLTGQSDLDPARAGEEGLKIYAVPLDQYNQPLKAAGSFTIDAFDLAQPNHPHIGHWTFPRARIEDYWINFLNLYTYVLPAPWQQLPRHPDITVRVTFTDALTRRAVSQEKVIRVDLQAATLPTTSPATRP